MIGFGWTNPFPFDMGGGVSDIETIREAILEEMKFILDPSDDTENYVESLGEATIIAVIWACNKRLSNQAIPETMLENLEVWEEATGLRPADGDLDIDRRARLSAKLRGQINNALGDIEGVASRALGINFVSLILVDPADVVSYWPGVNPGPPGYEWSSNFAFIAIKMNTINLTTNGFLDKRDRLSVQLQSLLPAWMNFEIGTSDSFISNQGTLDQTLL